MIDTKDEAARADLKRIEQEAMAEAQAFVEDYDAMGKVEAAVEAAETAFEFEEAQGE
jgi:hypothetical protein